MKTKQMKWTEKKSWSDLDKKDINPQLLLFFGTTDIIKDGQRIKELAARFPKATIIGCSTAGEIIEDDVFDNTIAATAIEFENTEIKINFTKVNGDSNRAGKDLGKALKHEGLKGILVISDGLSVNGSELVGGIVSEVGNHVTVTGGLAGDGGRFSATGIWADGEFKTNLVSAVGLYGNNVMIGHGSQGGWDKFGPQRKITKSKGNVVYEIDNEPALALYKRYLDANQIKELPGSALLFPIEVYPENELKKNVVRTVLSVNEIDQSMTFAGDVPQGWSAQLMRANFDNLINAASKAAENANNVSNDGDALAILISCVGRKMILKQRTADEVEKVMDNLPKNVRSLGFYSYGEISPLVDLKDSCALHNQTMTITVISEKKAA